MDIPIMTKSQRAMCNAKARKIMKEAGLWHKGWDVHHLDHNPMNNDLSNLVCLPRRCHMHKYHSDTFVYIKEGLKKSIEVRRKRVRCIETNEVYGSIVEAGKKTGIHPSDIGRVCRQERKTSGGFHWEFVVL